MSQGSPGPCGVKRRARAGASPQAAAVAASARSRVTSSGGPVLTPLAALADGPYSVVASWLPTRDLAQMDAACRLLLAQNGQPSGAWHRIADRTFYGMELDVAGGFVAFEAERNVRPRPAPGLWGLKSRLEMFHTQAPNFSPPFHGGMITNVAHADDVAYCRCRLRTDLLACRPDIGVYVEVEVLANADNLSLAVVDFEGGGRSSVTFSPETGAVLRERKVRESPRAIEGTYIHLLPAATLGRRFEGSMGLFLFGGHLAFFRRWAPGSGAAVVVGDSNGGEEGSTANDSANGTTGGTAGGTVGDSVGGTVLAEHPWETTGFCTDLHWAEGPRLTMCIAFRDAGAYNVRIVHVGRVPPVRPGWSAETYKDEKWSLLYGDDDHPLAI